MPACAPALCRAAQSSSPAWCPLAGLGELTAHEQELLARMPPHEAVVGAQVGEALPVVPGHALQHRALAVHDLVVADRQDEVLREGVVQAEGHLVVVVFAVHGILADVLERVVHPAHVPLEAEAEAAIVHRARHTGVGGALLRHGHDPRPPHRRRAAIGALQQVDGLEFSRPPWRWGSTRPPCASSRGRAWTPRHPRAGRRRGTPRASTARSTEVVRHLAAPVVVDQRVPVLVEALARVLVFVQRGAVEAGQAVRIGRESAPAPSPAARRVRGGGRRRRGRGTRGAARGGSSARTGPRAGSPRNRRRGAPRRQNSMWVKPRSAT
jgi:hypothetical protein